MIRHEGYRINILRADDVSAEIIDLPELSLDDAENEYLCQVNILSKDPNEDGTHIWLEVLWYDTEIDDFEDKIINETIISNNTPNHI